MLRKWMLLAAMVLPLVGCLSEENDYESTKDSQLPIALQQLVENSIVPAFNNLHQEVENFEAAAETFCTAKDAANLTALQTQWKALSAQWNRALVYQFGPMKADPIAPEMWYIESKLPTGTDETTTVRNLVTNQIDNTTTLDEAYFKTLPPKQVGILALEVLSFEATNQSQGSVDIIAEYTAKPRKCELLKGMAGLMSDYTEDFKIAWNGDYKTEFLSGSLEIGTSSSVALIEAAQQHLDYIKTRKLKDSADANLDAKLADYAKENIEASIEEVREMLAGVEGETTYSLFGHMLALENTTEKQTIETNLAAVETSLSSFTGSIKGQDTTTLASRIATLDGNFKRELPDGLNVNTSGLNFTDGD